LKPALFEDDLRRIGTALCGNRFHFLGFDAAQTPQVLEAAGMAYDCSLGFAEALGFRNGICHPFFLWDHANDRPSQVLEIPLMVMDATLQFKHYMGLSPSVATSAALALMEEVERWHGVMSILWHNTHFADYKYAGWRSVYINLLDAARSRGAVFLTGNQISEVHRGKPAFR
jgi:hypothetical protein